MNKKVLVFATSFLDELTSHPSGEGEPARLLEEAARQASVDIEYRCDRNPSEPVTHEEIQGAIAVIADLEPWESALLRRAGRTYGGDLSLIARYGIGYNSVDIAAAAEAGITVTNTPLASAQSTAEWAVSCLLGTAGRMIHQNARGRQGKLKSGVSRLDVKGKTMGIVGTGAIGREVVSLMSGFGMKILASDLFPDRLWAEEAGVEYVDLPRLCEVSDFITLHASGGQRIIGQEEIRLMKRSACLINCARGGLTDNRAAYQAVRSGGLRGFCLDEPWEYPDLPLENSLNVIATPHVGSDTDMGKLRMQQMSVESVVSFLRGETPAYAVGGVAL